MELKLKAGEFYGRTSKALLANGFRFTEKQYGCRATLPRHAHELSHFCLVLSGTYQEKIGAASFDREPLSLVFYPPDVSHAEEHFSGGRHFLVEIDPNGLDRVRDYGARLSDSVQLRSDDANWLAARMYREFSQRDAFSRLALESITLELLIAASRHRPCSSERRPPRWIETVKACLHENFTAPARLTDLAQVAGVHPTHLARVFRQFENCTVGDYLRRVRVDNARRQMAGSNTPLVEIALANGFSDQTHFTRSFRRVTGMTPTEFRRLFPQAR